jgi:hypothetical protein
MEIPLATILSSRLPRVERKAPEKIAAHCTAAFAHRNSSRLFFPDRCSRSSTDRTEVSLCPMGRDSNRIERFQILFENFAQQIP